MANENNAKDWFLGFVTTNSPMGRLDYLFSNIAVVLMIFIICTFINFIFTNINADIIIIILIIAVIYCRFHLIGRRIWHITKDPVKSSIYALVLTITYLGILIPIIGWVVGLLLLIAELVLLFKPGYAIPDNNDENESHQIYNIKLDGFLIFCIFCSLLAIFYAILNTELNLFGKLLCIVGMNLATTVIYTYKTTFNILSSSNKTHKHFLILPLSLLFSSFCSLILAIIPVDKYILSNNEIDKKQLGAGTQFVIGLILFLISLPIHWFAFIISIYCTMNDGSIINILWGLFVACMINEVVAIIPLLLVYMIRLIRSL